MGVWSQTKIVALNENVSLFTTLCRAFLYLFPWIDDNFYTLCKLYLGVYFVVCWRRVRDRGEEYKTQTPMTPPALENQSISA